MREKADPHLVEEMAHHGWGALEDAAEHFLLGGGGHSVPWGNCNSL